MDKVFIVRDANHFRLDQIGIEVERTPSGRWIVLRFGDEDEEAFPSALLKPAGEAE